ncbi:chemotaxis protein CheA [Roseibacterium sp. SDUM158016]|uniref:chemotaxis protein CheA n=1 Tax=Roseicyclus sediminis TaxID=2980997 RepID=UPI0021D1781E|nr:chemotaxis protein CheA [Roseibacterium sp. SDUM158016]MCU4651583.1 chemotaxis protein CheA [Roseibacterium sp. SDUM158016]
MSGLDELRISFFQECEDLLDSLGDGLREISDGDLGHDMETVHSVFRAVHSIKGGAGAFGLDGLVTFAHLFETVLDQMRCGSMEPTDGVMRTLLRAGDMLSDLVGCARDGREADGDRVTQMLAELDALADGADEDDDTPFEFVPTILSVAPMDDPVSNAGPEASDGPGPDAGIVVYRIDFKPRGALYGTGNEPLALLKALAQLGDLEIQADIAGIVPLTGFDEAEPHLAWGLRLATDATMEEILSVFEFVADLAEIDVDRMPRSDTAHLGPDLDDGISALKAPAQGVSHIKTPEGPLPPGPAAPTAPAEMAAILVDAQGGAETSRAGPAVLALAEESTLGNDPGGQAPQNSRKAKPATETTLAAAPATIRVNLDRVDRLINLIGELVIMEAMLSQAVETAGLASNSDVSNGLDGIKQLASGIQESVMAIRAQPLKPVFQRMHRIIREAADATGKQVRLVTTGDATEVDKTVIERLVDPLTHMIRNSVDHGLEDTATRIAAGKPETGTITLSAAHRSGRVIIEVSDDGGGINREKVREIAEARGLIPPGASLSLSEIDNLLFTPGFSSKEQVSALSGRGIGLDVVRREIQALGGRVTIQSAAGEGTTFTIALPLTLAVLEGMLVEFGGEMMVLPLSAILETLRPSSATIHSIGRTGRVVANRGELIPIIDLAEAFGIARPGDDTERDVLLLVECEAGRRAALAVDIIHDQRQVVIKSLEENYGAIPGISAATILGDGRIALIVDPEEIIVSAAPELPTPPLAANE